jgi:hypothetical protein
VDISSSCNDVINAVMMQVIVIKEITIFVMVSVVVLPAVDTNNNVIILLTVKT